MLWKYCFKLNKRIFSINVLALCLFSILFIGFNNIGAAQDANKRLLGIKEIFSHMEKALEAGDELAFKALWHTDGYSSNPTGRTGYSGEMVFKESTSKGWYIKPDFKTILKEGLADVIKSKDVIILPSHVWSFADHAPIRNTYTAIVHNGEQWLILGVSENAKGLEEMVDRFKNPW